MEYYLTVRATIELFKTERSGKVGSYQSGVRPNHYFQGSRSYAAGEVKFLGNESLAPGEVCDAEVSFLLDSSECETPKEGTTWEIREGQRIVGSGTILSILGS